MLTIYLCMPMLNQQIKEKILAFKIYIDLLFILTFALYISAFKFKYSHGCIKHLKTYGDTMFVLF